MPSHPQDPQEFQTWANDVSARLRAIERRILSKGEVPDPLQTFEDGDPLGDTVSINFGAGLLATLTGDRYVEVVGGAAASPVRTGYAYFDTSHVPFSIPSGGATFTRVPMQQDTLGIDNATDTFEFDSGDLKILREGHYIGTCAARFNPSSVSATAFQFAWAAFINGAGHFVQELWMPRQRLESFAFVNARLEVDDVVSCRVYQASGVSINIDIASILLSGPQ